MTMVTSMARLSVARTVSAVRAGNAAARSSMALRALSTKAEPQAKPAQKKGIRSLRDAAEALDAMIDEAERKMPKKYRPNMFAEFKQLNDTNGKVVVGPPELITVDKAVAVPSLMTKALDNSDRDVRVIATSGKITLLLTSFKNFGMNMLPAWRDAFLEIPHVAQDKQHAQFDVVTLNIIEDWYMKLVQGSITRGLQEKTPPELHERTLAHFGRCDDFRTVLDLNNSFVGYVHLIDSKGRIRWIAAGEVSEAEKQNLAKVTKELLEQQAVKERRR
ncbi:TPA: hypothetical protein N0F65_004430 [Lagenidium giganteum]|uniref:Uncharacterized protein n=1 Tax=Lagenidium giganteum TaxID=4803 RepID=A0AAV2ZCP1_9STRA|nr:TPA: hypothetical protein N0F65_004430 [Lagenidium giganteum]